jgi:transcriptional regulator with XRE-family HTH domain
MVQSVVIWLLLFGHSCRQIAGALSMSRSTVARWLKGFARATPVVAFHWRNLCPELGRQAGCTRFWIALLGRFQLGQVMRILHEMGVWIPCSDRKLAAWDGLQAAFR